MRLPMLTACWELFESQSFNTLELHETAAYNANSIFQYGEVTVWMPFWMTDENVGMEL